MVDDLRVSWVKLEAANEAGLSHRQRQHENSERVGASRLQRVRFAERDDQIGLAQLPVVRPRVTAARLLERRRQITRNAFGCARVSPLLNQRDLRIAERMLADERPI